MGCLILAYIKCTVLLQDPELCSLVRVGRSLVSWESDLVWI